MSPASTRTIILGSRPSKLARWQTDHVLEQLKAAWPDRSYQVITLVTEGDKRLDKPLPEIGGKGVFTAELEAALRSGEIDLAVHSLKDLPVDNPPGLCLGAISSRADAHDVLISTSGLTLAQLPAGARVGTSSLRRQVQLQAARPDLNFLTLRGNVDTRIRKAMQNDYDAIILAAAGLERLGLDHFISEYLPFEAMLPAPGQGALAIQCRAEDAALLALLKAVHDPATARAVTAERAFLSGLGGGCSAPVGAHAIDRDGRLELSGLVASPDGRQIIRVSISGSDPAKVGEQAARQALEQGAGELLK